MKEKKGCIREVGADRHKLGIWIGKRGINNLLMEGKGEIEHRQCREREREGGRVSEERGGEGNGRGVGGGIRIIFKYLWHIGLPDLY